MFYTYVWKDSAGVPFYVGKGGKDSYRRSREISRRSKEFKAIYAKGGCTVEIADEFILESEAFSSEVELIYLYGRRDMGGSLVNKTDGGEGSSGLKRGAPSAETRAKIAAGNRGKKLSAEHAAILLAAVKGRKLSEETRAKMGAAKIGNKHNVGRVVSAETRAKIGDANRNPSQEVRARMSDAQKKKEVSDEQLERLRLLATNKSKETIEKTRVSLILSPPTRANKSGFKGVSLHSATGRWQASICLNRKNRNLGMFPTPEEAARGYDRAAYAAWGDKCYLNFGVPEAELV